MTITVRDLVKVLQQFPGGLKVIVCNIDEGTESELTTLPWVTGYERDNKSLRYYTTDNAYTTQELNEDPTKENVIVIVI